MTIEKPAQLYSEQGATFGLARLSTNSNKPFNRYGNCPDTGCSVSSYYVELRRYKRIKN